MQHNPIVRHNAYHTIRSSRKMRRCCTFILLVTILVLCTSLTAPTTRAASNKSKLTLTISCDDLKNVRVTFIMGDVLEGSGDPVKIIDDIQWRENWTDAPTLTHDGKILRMLNATIDNFTNAVLGIKVINRGATVITRYPGADTIKVAMTLDLSDDDYVLTPFGFPGLSRAVLMEYTELEVTVSTGPNVGIATSDINIAHIRLPISEYFRYADQPYRFTLVDKPFVTPLGMFINLLVYMGGGIALSGYSRKYMRGVRLGTEIWVPMIIVYILAFVPLYLFYIFITIGIVMTALRCFKALRIPKIKQKKKTVSGREVEKYVPRHTAKASPKAPHLPAMRPPMPYARAKAQAPIDARKRRTAPKAPPKKGDAVDKTYQELLKYASKPMAPKAPAMTTPVPRAQPKPASQPASIPAPKPGAAPDRPKAMMPPAPRAQPKPAPRPEPRPSPDRGAVPKPKKRAEGSESDDQ